MSIIEGIRTWLSGFTGFTGGVGSVDFLPAEALSYSVDSVPCAETVKRYLDGSGLKQYLFVVAGREYLDGDGALGEENSELYEALGAWMNEKTKAGVLPSIGEGRTALKVTSTGPAYPISVDGHGTARYQMQCRLEYFEEGTR